MWVGFLQLTIVSGRVRLDMGRRHLAVLDLESVSLSPDATEDSRAVKS